VSMIARLPSSAGSVGALRALTFLVIVLTTIVSAPGKGLASDVGAPETPTVGPFVDVPQDGTHAQAIATLAERGVVTGVSSDHFAPDRALTRGQSATMLANLLQIPPGGGPAGFVDTAGSVHEAAIHALANQGLVTGTTQTTFEPDRTLTRAHLVAMLVRADGHDDYDPTTATVRLPDGRVMAGSDVASTHGLRGHTLEVELVWGILLGYLHGRADGSIQPDAPVSRAQGASFLVRYDDAMREPPEIDFGQSDGRSAAQIDHGTDLRAADTGPTIPREGLTPSGPVRSEHDGQVIEGLDISVSGRDNIALLVEHDDVVVRNNRIRYPDGADGIRIASGTSRVVIEHNELDAVRMAEEPRGHLTDDDGNFLNNNLGSRAIDARGRATVRRNLVTLTLDGIRLHASGSRAEENYIERLFTSADSPGGLATHGTSISLPGGQSDVQVARNRVVAGSSGGIVLYAQYGSQVRNTVADNLVIGVGEGFGIYGGRTHPESGHMHNNREVRIDGNSFSGTFGFPGVLGGGTNTAVDLERPGNTFRDNRWRGHPDEIPARCGIRQDACE
jgi:hypothetical protein